MKQKHDEQERISIEQAYLTVKEVAQYLGMKTSTVYARVPEIPHYRIGNLIRFRKEDVDAWMETRREGARGHRSGTKQPISAIDIDDIVRTTIDALKARSYNSSGKSDHVRDLRKEVKNGTI